MDEWRRWPTRWVLLALFTPVGLFAVAFSASASGSIERRASLLPLSFVVGSALFCIPLLFLAVFVRTRALFLTSLVFFCASVPVALVNVARDEHSTAGVQIF